VFLYGANGIGKTTLVKQQLSSIFSYTHQIQDEEPWTLGYGYIDCIYCKKELEISMHLYKTLISNKPLLSNQTSTSFINLVKAVKQQVIKGKIRYLVFDNIDEIVHRKLFRKIMAVRRALKDYVRIVMICNGCIPKLSFFDEFLATEANFFPIFMPPPSREHLKEVLRDKVNEITNPEVYSLFIDLIYSEYSQYTTHINYYLYLCKMIIPILFKELNMETLQIQDMQKIYNIRFRRIGKYFIRYFFLPITEHVKDIEYEDDWCDESFEYEKVLENGLTYLEGILLVAAYISSHNPISIDRKLFIRTKRLSIVSSIESIIRL